MELTRCLSFIPPTFFIFYLLLVLNFGLYIIYAHTHRSLKVAMVSNCSFRILAESTQPVNQICPVGMLTPMGHAHLLSIIPQRMTMIRRQLYQQRIYLRLKNRWSSLFHRPIVHEIMILLCLLRPPRLHRFHPRLLPTSERYFYGRRQQRRHMVYFWLQYYHSLNTNSATKT